MSVASDVRSFTDLRAFAAKPGHGTLTAGGTPLPMADGPVTIAAMTLAGGAQVAAQQGDLFVIVLAGGLTIDDIVVPVGGSIVVPDGIGYGWSAAAGTRIVTMHCAEGGAGADAPVPINEAAALQPSSAPLATLLVSSTPACRNHTDYRSVNGEFLCGTWDSTPYHRLPMRYGHHELMHLTAGCVTFQDETGRRATFTAGDVFLVERGAICSWESEGIVKKVYAIWRPA